MTFSAELLVATLAIAGIVIVVSALLSGLIERSGLPQVAVFLAIGAGLGPAGLGVLNVNLDSPALRTVATISLALVLFTDAVTLNIREVRSHGGLALRVLGPGTLLSAAVVAVIAWRLLQLPPAAAAILGAALASTDPVLLRPLLKSRDLPDATRHALRLESGLNDAVLLPVIVVAMALLAGQMTPGGTGWGRLILHLFVLGPGAGVAVGVLAIAALDLIRKQLGVRRDYESLYSLGVAFTAFAAAEAVHGSGFLAAFAAGLTISALDVELCDCFVEYGEVTAEMLLLFTFVLFGSSLIWSGFTILSGATVLFAVAAIVARPPVFLASLLGSHVAKPNRWMIAWFGPRGLSSLLLVLLPVFAGLPGSEQLFKISTLVVVLSIVLHSGSPLLLRRLGRKTAPEATETTRTGGETGTRAEPSAAALPARGTHTISIDELKDLWKTGEPVRVLDVRSQRSFDDSDRQAEGALRLAPDHAVERASELGLRRDAWLIAYCA
jgi:NhaP-type Na+/H+ or K+/H+ antiporter